MLESGIERARTKTVATVGPASESHEMLCELIRRGVDVFRINMAHGTREEHDQMRQRIRVASAELGRPVHPHRPVGSQDSPGATADRSAGL